MQVSTTEPTVNQYRNQRQCHLILTMKIGPDILQLSDTWKGERNFTNNIYVEFFILR